MVSDRKHWHREGLLVNCVNSIRTHDPDATVCIIGEEPSAARLRAAGLLDEGTRFISSVRGAGGRKGSVFIDMDDGLQFARQRGFEKVFFVPEDSQFIRDPRPLVLEAEASFADRPGVSVIAGICMDSTILPNWPAATEWRREEDGSYLVSADYAMLMSGIVSLPLLERSGFRFGNGTERGINNWWVKRC